MPVSWIEEITDPEVKMWAYGLYEQRDVLFTGDRQKDGYPVVAEIPVTDADIERFSPVLDKGVAIIMCHRDSINPIDDESVVYPIEDIIFDLECSGLKRG